MRLAVVGNGYVGTVTVLYIKESLTEQAALDIIQVTFLTAP
jgi:hypothetical protein